MQVSTMEKQNEHENGLHDSCWLLRDCYHNGGSKSKKVENGMGAGLVIL